MNDIEFDRLDVFGLIERLQKLERVDLEERLNYIEKQLKYFAFACTSIDKSFKQGIMISVDKESMNIINPIKDVISNLKEEVISIQQLRQGIEKQSKEKTILETLKQINNQLKDLNKKMNNMQEEGLIKDINLAFTVDGYEMTKKKPVKVNKQSGRMKKTEAVNGKD